MVRAIINGRGIICGSLGTGRGCWLLARVIVDPESLGSRGLLLEHNLVICPAKPKVVIFIEIANVAEEILLTQIFRLTVSSVKSIMAARPF
jgi:hypothetical protein